jgi:Family of unknown function (DUF6093)
MSLNLDAFVPVVEQYMFDQIQVTRPPTEAELVLDEATGQYNTPTVEVVYEGKAWVAAIGTPAENMRGMADQARVQYEIGLPKAGAETFKPLDLVEVLECKFDPTMVGKVLTLHGEINSTFTVFRRLGAFLDVSSSER